MFLATLAFVQLQAVKGSYKLLLIGNNLALNPFSEILQDVGDFVI